MIANLKVKLVPDSLKIKVKYFTDQIQHMEKIEKGDWIDLRAAETIRLKKGQFRLIPLGFAMEIPEGYEAHVSPRSSTFKNFKILQVNSVGVIDESYCGNEDQWFFPAYAMEDTIIRQNDRFCQFRLIEKMPKIEIEIVDDLGNENREGHGSTGVE